MKNKKMRRALSIILCIAMLLGSNVQAFAAGIDITDDGTYLDKEYDSQVDAVEALIDAIGKVKYTDDSLAKIDAAEKAYDNLTATEKDQIENFCILRAARNAYDALAADYTDTSDLMVVYSDNIGDIKWTVYQNGLLEISGDGEIPSYSRMGGPWLDYASSINSILVRSSITKIGENAFYGCNNVKEITLPFVGESRIQKKSLAEGYRNHFGYIFGYTKKDHTTTSEFSRSIGYNWDYGYNYSYYYSSTYNGTGYINSFYTWEYAMPKSLRTVTITDANEIGVAAFCYCNISKLVLNNGITSIGDGAFKGNDWYKNLTDEFVIDGDNVLIKYNGTKSDVIIPQMVISIAGGVFKGKTDITSVTLPEDLEIIGENAFDGCKNLTAMTIPKSVISIGANAIPSTCTINVYRPSAGYDYRSTNRIVLNDSYTSGNETYYYVVNDDGCAEIIGCTTTSTELTVPTDFDGIAVNKIGNYGFANCTTLNSITIPKNILNIGKYAFSGCTGIVNATIPTTVYTVGDYAFNNCTGLKYVTISEGVQALGEGAFYNCTSLTEVVVPDTASYVGAYAFYNCKSMITATIGTTTKFIGDYTFYNCTRLGNVVIGLNVDSIGDYAFYGCRLDKVTIPLATTRIGRYAFAENIMMTKATLRKNLLTIGDGAFKNDGLLATVSIPEAVTYIGAEAFEKCKSITSIIIPAGVTKIRNRAFYGCSSLASITINGNVTYVGDSAFLHNAFESITLPESVTVLGDRSFYRCNKLKEITIPSSVTRIGNSAFWECETLGNVSMPDSVASVGQYAFAYTDDLTIVIRKNNGAVAESMLKGQGMKHIVIDPEISAIGNNAFDSCDGLISVTYGDESVNDGEYKFSSALKTVGSEAFKDNPKLRNFIVPDTIESIGTKAFYVNEEKYIPEDITVTFYYVDGVIAANILDSQYAWHIVVDDDIYTLSDKAFYNCPVLETISLPDTISSVGKDVFANSGSNVTAIFKGVDGTIDASVYDGKTTGLKYIAIEDSVDVIDDYAFANADTVLGVVIADVDNIGKYAFYQGGAIEYVEIGSCELIDDYAFAYDSNINRFEIDGKLEIVGEHAFDSCKSIPKMVLPETVREIGAYAFYDCNSMATINVPVGVTEINNHTFFGCASLTGIELPDTVAMIGDYAYYGCVVAKTLDMSSTTKSIGAYAFYNCNQVEEINLPDTLQSIGDYAFRSCSGITEVRVPDSVTELGDCVFYACTNLEEAEFGTGITSIGNSEFYGCVNFEKLTLNGDVDYIHDLAFYGAEDVVVYEYDNDYVEEYCDDMGIEYCNLGQGHKHDYTGSEEIISAPSCEEAGSKKVHCSDPHGLIRMFFENGFGVVLKRATPFPFNMALRILFVCVQFHLFL